MSQSSRPVRAPRCASATARLTATVVFPTPPLPLLTAIVCLTNGIRLSGSAIGSPISRALHYKKPVECVSIWERRPGARFLRGEIDRHNPVLPARFGLVERLIGGLDHPVGRRADLAGDRGDADADRDGVGGRVVGKEHVVHHHLPDSL